MCFNSCVTIKIFPFLVCILLFLLLPYSVLQDVMGL